jgi:hypothetical protein
MRRSFSPALTAAILVTTTVTVSFYVAAADSSGLRVPKKVEAGAAFSIPTSARGNAVLYIVSPAQVLRRTVAPGETIAIAAGELHNAGHYLALLVSAASTGKAEFDVVAAAQPVTVSFFAKPSRLPVHLPDAVSGVAYVYDVFRNLVLTPSQVSFQLADSAGGTQTRTVATSDGVAWTRMNSAPKAGPAQFEVSAGGVKDKRVVHQVPSDPCNLRMTARRSGPRMILETAPVRDCSGNAVSDGTIVTFTQTYNGRSVDTVDVPLKRDIARTEIPVREGSVISVATGVVLGNEIRLGESR